MHPAQIEADPWWQAKMLVYLTEDRLAAPYLEREAQREQQRAERERKRQQGRNMRGK